jgi:hypothetical protein
MTVHAYRIYAQKPTDVSKAEANQIIDEWKAQNTPWTEDPADHDLSVSNTKLDGSGTECYLGTVRFEFSDDADQLTQDINYGLSGVVGWARIGYHKCDHDEGSGTGCSWDSSTEFGTVPGDVPEFV